MNLLSKTGRVIVRLQQLMDTYHRRDDGSESPILADTRFDNHNKVTITGIVVHGTDSPDSNPLEDANRIMPRTRHYPLGYIGGGVFEVDIQPGDRVWFHYLCAEDKSQMERNVDGSWDVAMQVSDIFLIRRGDRLISNQNWCMGEAYKEPELNLVDMHGYEAVAKMSPGKGIEMVKGFNLTSYVDEAVMYHIDYCRYRGVHDEVEMGDRLYLAKDATFPNVIMNKQRVLFRQTDILAVYEPRVEEVRPVGENHLVRVDLEEYKSTVIHHTVITKAPEFATIVASGAHCKHASPGDKIMFTRRWTRLLTKEYWLVNDNEILSILES